MLMGTMPSIKVEIKFGELVQSVKEFANFPVKSLNKLHDCVKLGVSDAINELLKTEIDLFLGDPDEKDNKRNGFHPSRDFALKGIGCIRIRIPKDRKGRFTSKIIPKGQRIDERLKADMAILSLAGISTRCLGMISKRLLGVEASKNTVHRSLDILADEAQRWLRRPITAQYWALFIDGTNFRIQRQGSTEKEPLLVVLGIDQNDFRSILSIESGARDNIDCWRNVFRDLKERGLDPKYVKIGVMDGLPGLEKLFKEEFLSAKTGRCWFHALQNILPRVPTRIESAFKVMIDKIMYADSEDSARKAFEKIKLEFEKDASKAVECLSRNLDSLLVHYQFNSIYWRVLRTTNPIERINKEFKRRTKSMETIGDKNLMTVVAFVALRLEMGWKSKSVTSLTLKNLKFMRQNENNSNPVEQTLDELGLKL